MNVMPKGRRDKERNERDGGYDWCMVKNICTVRSFKLLYI